MALTSDLLHVLPLLSAALWLFIGLGAFGRYGLSSPFVRALAVFCVLVSAWALVDWYFLGLPDTTTESLAIAVANVRVSILSVASLVILLASKWLSLGHSRYDWLLVLPVLGSIAIVWTGMTPEVSFASGIPELVRDPVRYALYVLQVMGYLLVAALLALSLILQRRDMPARLRRPAIWSIGALFVFVILWASTNVFASFTQNPNVPEFSSVLFIPALMAAIAFARRTPEEIGEIFRSVSAVPQRVSALYVFYRTGEPLVALGSSRNLPIEAEQLEGVLDIVGNFVETSMLEFRGYAVTALRFDRLGIVAVRGKHIIVAAVYEGPVYDALRSELVRSLRDFEQRRGASLATWEEASKTAEEVADDLARLLRSPEPAGKPAVKTPPRDGGGAADRKETSSVLR